MLRKKRGDEEKTDSFAAGSVASNSQAQKPVTSVRNLSYLGERADQLQAEMGALLLFNNHFYGEGDEFAATSAIIGFCGDGPKEISLVEARSICQAAEKLLQGQMASLLFNIHNSEEQARGLSEFKQLLMLSLKKINLVALEVKLFCGVCQQLEKIVVNYGKFAYFMPAFIRARIELQIKLISVILRAGKVILMTITSSEEDGSVEDKKKFYSQIAKLIRMLEKHYVNLIYARYGDENDADMVLALQDFNQARGKLIDLLGVFDGASFDVLPQDLVVFKNFLSRFVVNVQDDLFHHIITMSYFREKKDIKNCLLEERASLLGAGADKVEVCSKEMGEMAAIRASCQALTPKRYSPLLIAWKKANTQADAGQLKEAWIDYCEVSEHVKVLLSLGKGAFVASNIIQFNVCQAALRQTLLFILFIIQKGQLAQNDPLLTRLLSNVTQSLDKMKLTMSGEPPESLMLREGSQNLLILVNILLSLEKKRASEESARDVAGPSDAAKAVDEALVELFGLSFDPDAEQIESLKDLLTLAILNAIHPASYQDHLDQIRQQCRAILCTHETSFIDKQFFLKEFHIEVIKQLVNFGCFPLRLSKASKHHIQFQLDLIKMLMMILSDLLVYVIRTEEDSMSARRVLFGEVDLLLRLVSKQYLFLLHGVDVLGGPDVLQEVWLQSIDYFEAVEKEFLEPIREFVDSISGLPFQFEVLHQIILNAKFSIINETIILTQIMMKSEARKLQSHREGFKCEIRAFHQRLERMPLSDIFDEPLCQYLVGCGLCNFKLLIAAGKTHHSALYGEVLKKMSFHMGMRLIFSEIFVDQTELECRYAGLYQRRYAHMQTQKEVCKAFLRGCEKIESKHYLAGLRDFIQCLENINEAMGGADARISFDLYCLMQTLILRMTFHVVVTRRKLTKEAFDKCETDLEKKIMDNLIVMNQVVDSKGLVLTKDLNAMFEKGGGDHFLTITVLKVSLYDSPRIDEGKALIKVEDSRIAVGLSTEGEKDIRDPTGECAVTAKNKKRKKRKKQEEQAGDKARRIQEKKERAEEGRRRRESEKFRIEQERREEQVKREREAEEELRRKEAARIVEKAHQLEIAEHDRIAKCARQKKKDQALLNKIQRDIDLSNVDLAVNIADLSMEAVDKAERRYKFARDKLKGLGARLDPALVVKLVNWMDQGALKVETKKSQIEERERLALIEQRKRAKAEKERVESERKPSVMAEIPKDMVVIRRNSGDSHHSDDSNSGSVSSRSTISSSGVSSDEAPDLNKAKIYLEVIRACQAFFDANPKVSEIFDKFIYLSLTGGAIADIYYVYKNVSDPVERQRVWRILIADLDCICPHDVRLSSLQGNFDKEQLIVPTTAAPSVLKGWCDGFEFDIRQAQSADICLELLATDIEISSMGLKGKHLICPAGLESLHRRKVSMVAKTEEEIIRCLFEDPFRIFRIMRKIYKCEVYDSLEDKCLVDVIHQKKNHYLDDNLAHALGSVSSGNFPKSFEKLDVSYGRFIGAFLKFFSEGPARIHFECAVRHDLFNAFFSLINLPDELAMLKNIFSDSSFYQYIKVGLSQVESMESKISRMYGLIDLLIRWMILWLPDKSLLVNQLGGFINVAMGILVCQDEQRQQVDCFHEKREHVKVQMANRWFEEFKDHPDIQFGLGTLLQPTGAQLTCHFAFPVSMARTPASVDPTVPGVSHAVAP